MKSMIGNVVQLTIFGESHGSAIGMVLDGLAPGIKLDLAYINHQLELRKPKGRISTARKESDAPNIVSGVFEGYTTGTPLCIMFENNNTQSKDYSKTKNLMRPSHADYSGYMKYKGYNDYRGGGHFSGRLTTPIVCAGAIAKQILESKGIFIGSHILKINTIHDEGFNYLDEDALKQQIVHVNEQQFPVMNEDCAKRMIEHIENAAENGDSVGGVIETGIVHMECGIGEPMFHSLESSIAHYLFSVPAIKGVEFGLGFEFANHYGSNVNDEFYYDDKHCVKTKTNNNGGINGGISNGMPIIIKCVVKPTPSIYKQQNTIDIENKCNTKLQINGRHDPAIIHRARVVIDSVVALAILDLMSERHGYMWMGE
ncbi:MAG: chorismate synthase [Erysipelotrichia bacterium]|nr:chorismate synthase [Erysipelotrichia bacterium]NCC54339.1 chorismate synthase [Erysipelotrichia bacterium]